MKHYNYIILILTSIFYLSFCNTTAIGQDSKKYYLIAGSYKTEADAQHAVDSLKVLGYPSEIVGKNDYGSFRISFNSFDNYTDATKELNRIKSQVTPNVWVFEGKADISNSQATNTDNKSNNKKSYNWIWWVGGIILILVILGVIFNSRCPNCKKFLKKKFLNSEEYDRKDFVKLKKGERTWNNGKAIQTTPDTYEPWVKIKYYNYYQCLNCGHKWTEKGERDESLVK